MNLSDVNFFNNWRKLGVYVKPRWVCVEGRFHLVLDVGPGMMVIRAADPALTKEAASAQSDAIFKAGKLAISRSISS
jgi:hypothetical protein